MSEQQTLQIDEHRLAQTSYCRFLTLHMEIFMLVYPGLLKPAKTGVCKVSHKFTFINLHPFHSYSQGYLEQMVVFSVVSF